MPTKSAAQERLMQAAAHTKGGFGGVPQSVGKEFIENDLYQERKHSRNSGGVFKSPGEPDNFKFNEHAHPRDRDGIFNSGTAEKDDAEDPCWEGYEQYGMKSKGGKEVPNCVPTKDDSEAWTRKEGKNKEGGLNKKGRESYNKAHGAHLKAPQPEGGSRKKSFCSRMKGMKEKLTSEETKHDPDSRINKALRKWKCDAQGNRLGPKELVEDSLRFLLGNPNPITDDAAAQYVELDAPAPAPIDPQGGAATRAAGIMFVNEKGQILFLRRGNGGDYPFTWCVPGGHLGFGESDEDAARRECKEETGIDYTGPLQRLHDDGQFVTFLADKVPTYDVTLNYESEGYCWAMPHSAPNPLHPGINTAMRIASVGTELDVARLMVEGLLPSPQTYANMHLLAIRITGTGLAYRSSIGEHVWRDSSLYLNDEFLQRCNGLTVIMDHPDGSILDSKEYKDRAIGAVMLPYIKGDEVWGIAKIYDDAAMKEILTNEISTSPSVVFDETSGNTTLVTESGEPLLIEGRGFLLDHIAIVTPDRGSKGVWDKGGAPRGVQINNSEVSTMTDKTEAKADASGDKLDAILNVVTGLVARVDAMEKNMPAEPYMAAADRKRKDDDRAMKDDEMMMDDDDDARMDDDEDMKSKKDDARAKKDDARAKKDSMKMKFKKDAKRMDEDEEEEEEKHEAKKDNEGKVEMPAGEMHFTDDDAKKDEEAAKMDEEAGMYSDAQAACDSVYAAFGKRASRPLQGESLLGYRKRLLRGLQTYSDAYKAIDLRSIKDAALLAIAEKQIFADALAASKIVAHGDSLVENRTTDRAGRTISTFTGPVSAWLDDFKVPALRAMQFHTPNSQTR